jgi:hypothetical protein
VRLSRAALHHGLNDGDRQVRTLSAKYDALGPLDV